MPAEYSFAGKLVESIGITGLIVFVIWKVAVASLKVIEVWAPRFLDAQQQQAGAMAALAQAVKDGQGEQREVLLAVRVMSSKVDEMRDAFGGLVEELKEHVHASEVAGR